MDYGLAREPARDHRKVRALAVDRVRQHRSLAVDALLYEAGIELHDLLDRHRDLVRPELPPQRLAVDDCFLQEAHAEPDTFADDYDLGVEVVATAGADTDHASVPDDQPLHHRLGYDHRAGLLSLLREPGVETSAQDGERVRVIAIAEVLVVEADVGLRRHHPPTLFDDRPFQRCFF